MNPDRKTANSSRNTRLFVFDIPNAKVTAEYAYRLEVATEFDPRPKMAPDEMKVSAVVYLNPTTLLILERTDWVAKLYSVDLGKATNILGSRWNNPSTAPTLEALDDPASADVQVLPKSLLVDLNRLGGIPEKIEGVAIVDQNTIAIANDNDFDIDEGNMETAGSNTSKGVKSRILLISLARPLPLK